MKGLLVAVSPEVAPTATRVCVPSATPDGTAAPNPLAPPLLPVLSVEGDVKRVVPVALSRWIVTFSELPKEVSAPPVTMPGSVVRLWPVPMEKVLGTETLNVLLVAVSPEVAPTATRVCVPSATPDGMAAPNPLAPPLLPVLSVEGDVKRVVPVALSRWIVTFSEPPKEVSAPPVTMPGSVVRLWPVPMEKVLGTETVNVLLVAVSPEVAPTATRVCVPSATPDGTAAPNPLAPPLLPVRQRGGRREEGGAGGAVEVDRHVLRAAEGGQRPAGDHAGERRQALAGADGEGRGIDRDRRATGAFASRSSCRARGSRRSTTFPAGPPVRCSGERRPSPSIRPWLQSVSRLSVRCSG